MNRRPDDPTRYPQGRAHVNGTRPDDGRTAVTEDGRSLTAWVVWDWSRNVDEQLDAIASDTFDLADRVHFLTAIVVAAFLVLIVALAITIGVTVL